jgi:hypothetical protein
MDQHHDDAWLPPSPAPTDNMYTPPQRHVIMAIAESCSMLNRLIIGVVCCKRLWLYHRRGVLRWRETKTRFHTAMLMTVPFYMPYFTFCLVHYEEWQCSIPQDANPPLYIAWARFYALYRIGLILQLYCVSLVVSTWSLFLSWAEVLRSRSTEHSAMRYQVGVNSGYRGGPPRGMQQSARHVRLMRWLVALNVLNLLGSLGLNLYSIARPEEDANRGDSSSSGQSYSLFLTVNWLFLDLVQLCLALFLVSRGRAILSRMRATGVLDAQAQKMVALKVNLCLGLLVSCLLVEIVCRCLISIPNLDEKFSDPDKGRPQPVYGLWRGLEEQPLLWQLCGYILPYDVVSFCLLYLMRAPPQRQPAEFSVHSGQDAYGEDGTTTGGVGGIDSSPLVRGSGYGDSESDVTVRPSDDLDDSGPRDPSWASSKVSGQGDALLTI